MIWNPVISLASKLAEYLFSPIGRQIGYVFNHKSNIQELKVQSDKLQGERQSVQHRVDEAKRHGEEIEDMVDKWLKSVDDATLEVDKILHDNDTANMKCFMGLCPNLKMRHQLSKKAKKKKKVVVQIQAEGKFDRVSYHTSPPWTGPAKGYEVFESRTLVLKEIVEALKDDEVNMIGVYGMGGVGKTTFVKEVASQVMEEGIFRKVVTATVTHMADIKRIQQEIAEWLGCRLVEETVRVRATRLSEQLKQEEKILIILDDIWVRIRLEEIGIPFGNDHNKGCKILMTSRNQNVFLEMDVVRIFRLEVLQEKEAWHLFQKKVGNVNHPNLAMEVAKRCAGLPILIVTVATALKNKQLFEWKNALEQLKRFDDSEMDEQVTSALKLSYNFLKGEEIKSLFLLCGRHVFRSYEVDNLLKYAVGLGLFKRSRTLEEARNRLHKYVSDLKASCLLLEGIHEGDVMMHDVVRNFAISVASTDHHVFILAYDTVLEWPSKDELERCSAIYLRQCEIPELPAAFECPKLESFLLDNYLLDGQNAFLKIPDDFFSTMKELKVLDLTGLHLSSLPSSLKFLQNLQTLCLDYCVLEDIAAIGELNNLQVLSLLGSNIVQLPREIGKLTRLRLLDLGDCSSLEVIPPDVLSSLTRLEDLHMGRSFVQWEGEEHDAQRENANLAELKLLTNLLTLDIHIIDEKILPRDLFFEKLERFKIVIGDIWDWSCKDETSRMLKLKLNTGFQLESMKLLLKRTEYLYLDDLRGVKNVLCELNGLGFPELKHLRVQNSHEIQYIIDSVRLGPLVFFPILESLFLDHLINLEKICCGALEANSFSSLRKLNVKHCDNLKHLFSFSMARGLARLEELNVSNCKLMEGIVAREIGDDSGNDVVIEFTQLHAMTLEYLPKFTSFISQVQVPFTNAGSEEIVSADHEPEILVPIFNRKITFPNLAELKLSSVSLEKIWSNQLTQLSPRLTILEVDGCENLNYVFPSSVVESLAQLKSLEICNCKSVEEIIAPQRLGEETVIKILFPKLGLLKLSGLPKLTSFFSGNSIEFPSLKVLMIGHCAELRTFISSSESTDVASSSEFGQEDSILFDEKVAFPDLEKLHIRFFPKLKMIWRDHIQANSFCKLELLEVVACEELLQIFPSNILRGFQKLECLCVANCRSLKEVFDLQMSTNVKEMHVEAAATKLRILKLMNLPVMKHVWNEDPQKILSFANLSSVDVSRCPSLNSLFPPSIAKNLPRLAETIINDCGLVEIVSKEEGLEATPKFVFRQLKSLKLWRLQKLRSFYPGVHAFECPMLKCLRVGHCDNFKIFASQFQELQETQVEIQPLRKVISNLEELTLSSNEITMIWQGQFEDRFDKLKVLGLYCFHDASTDFPFNLLRKFPNTEKLHVVCSDFNEIFPYGFVVEEYARAFAQIRHLRLDFFPKMKHIWNPESRHVQVLQNLESLEIWNCDSLVTLAPHSASFQNLTTLDVWQCEILVSIITSSTAKEMVNLTKMSVRECNKVTEIVVNGGDEDQQQSEIVFSKLKSITLHCLESLTSFCSMTSCTIKFPSLVALAVTHCPRMSVFARGVVSVPRLPKAIPMGERGKMIWKKDINDTINHLHKQRLSEQE
ncbi:probable disease resistance protein At4g27220 isoform X2 [Hevea brasiliensis]|uniref:probable disease resistance protein At4g27220 isoform X2 n=1 Tax=Hevea brasiliensis TaxID=3981 RepID=UPI0025D7D515|nr:probable disease resistance protein At4g27220 isoform X2 [Hevea brasiliensis]XP_058000520.1 probable disease resistance protein At4g27220 isoform X2 [Hevea brasiliensis]